MWFNVFQEAGFFGFCLLLSNLPRRAETGDLKIIECSPKEMNAFRDGNGPSGFTGFLQITEKERHFNGLKSVEKCFLVRNGKMIRLQGQKGFCHKAVYNTDPDRHVVEDLSALNEIKAKPDEYYY